jgi:hypothetical protein
MNVFQTPLQTIHIKAKQFTFGSFTHIGVHIHTAETKVLQHIIYLDFIIVLWYFLFVLFCLKKILVTIQWVNNVITFQ